MHKSWCSLLFALALAHALDSQTPSQDTSPTKDGWIDLFDGKTLDGWRQLNGTAKYEVRDGAIIGTTKRGSPNSFLCTERFYGDFELVFEVKLFDGKLNSGVQIRSHSYPAYRKGRVHGYQVEVSTNGHAGFIYDEARRGWLSTDKDRSDKTARAAFKKDEWNHYRVVCRGSSIRTWVNGVPVAKLEDPLVANGFIGLQVHGVRDDPKWKVAWRKIRLREIGDGGGWVSLFDGKTLAGWKANENPKSARVADGAIVVGGARSHIFYVGGTYSHSFKNFELKAKVMTEPGANSGIYFHTIFQENGWPTKGYECQVNSTHRDWRKTGGLYGIRDLRESPAKDNQWFEVYVKVRGKRITVQIDGKQVVDYTEPGEAKRPANMKGRLLSRGTFALQAHDPKSIVHYKDLWIKVLAE